MIKYRTSRYEEAKIQKVEVTRETASTVFFIEDYGYRAKKVERKEAKSTEGHKWHDSWEEAHAYLTSRAADSLIGARNRLQRAQDIVGNVKGMKEQKE